MYLCLSLDHRVMDGLEAAAFLGACRQWLEGVSTATALE
jgi:pyruvate/2-oxoglutarate dehydrogenase complex dihydrolipoamide acyltransferase (E2) component